MKTIQEAAKNSFDRLSIAGADTNEADFIGGFKIGFEFAQRWIPVEEEMPISGVYVICRQDNHLPFVGCYSNNSNMFKNPDTEDILELPIGDQLSGVNMAI